MQLSRAFLVVNVLLTLTFTCVASQTVCGGSLKGPSGSIVSPNYPSDYPKSAVCSWTITGQPNEIINLKFNDLDLDGYADSCPDVVNIYDGDSSRAPLLRQMCRSKSSTELSALLIRSTGNKMFVTFTSDRLNQRSGFSATYLTHVCPPMMYGTETCNNMCSKCDPVNTEYCNNVNGDCHCKPGYRSPTCADNINECTETTVDRCPADYKMCVDSPGSYACACNPGLIMNSAGNCIANPSCTRTCLNGLCGVGTSGENICYCPKNLVLRPGDICGSCPAMTYGANCENSCNCNLATTISCNPRTGQCICRPGWSSANCGQDVDECSLSRSLGVCDNVPNRRCINTIGSYRCECRGGYIPGAPGCVKIPCLYTLNRINNRLTTASPYWPNADCTWRIQTATRSTIVLRFTRFQTESGRDFVYIYDGPNSNSQLLGVYSGTQTFQTPIRSTTNNMFIRFTSDDSTQAAGLVGTITQTTYPPQCGNRIVATVNRRTITPIRSSSIFCYWAISAPVGSIISISVNSARTEANCRTYLAVYMGTYPGAPLFAKYCGTAVPTPIRIPGPDVFIVYQSESASNAVAFRADVNFCPPFRFGRAQCNTPCPCRVANSESCDSVTGACFCRPGWTGANCDVDIDECFTRTHSCVETEKCTNTLGSYTCSPDCDATLSPILENQQLVKRDSGVIRTHKYNTYPLYRAQCNWFITGDQGDVITFHVEEGNFQLVERAYCYEDTLNIFDGGLGADQQIGQYCGTKIPRLIRTETNAMILQLRTAYGYHTGFTGNYYIHPCRPFTWGKKCEYDCGCKQVNTEFCDSTKGICVCKPGYTDTYCNDDVDECLSVKCKDNAVCTNTLGSYSCVCREGYKENLLGICEINVTTCTSKITCIPDKESCTTLNGKESCLCPDGTNDVERTGNVHYCSELLYPHSEIAGDSLRPREKSDYGTVTFNEAVPFGTISVSNAYIHLEGVISLDSPYKNGVNVLLIKPFYTEIKDDCQVYYHLYEKCQPSVFSEASSTSSPEKQTVMNRAKKDIIREAKLTDFDVKTVLVVTWKNVKSAKPQQNVNTRASVAINTNTFQVIFISGFAKKSGGDFSTTETSYVLYIYPNSEVNWCDKDVKVGYFADSVHSDNVQGIDSRWFKKDDSKQIIYYQVSGLQPSIPPTPRQQCERFVCKNSGLITDEKYQREIEELYKCPCSLDRLGLQWVIFQERRADNIYCFSISLVAKLRLLSTNPLNKLCCYKWNRPSDSIDWETYADRLSESTLINNSPDSGHVVPGEPGWFEGVTESMAAHQLCCNGANSDKLCKRFYKIYPDMECTYDVEFVPAYLLGDPTVVTLDNVTYLMNGWGEYTLMYVQSEQFSLQARTDRLQTSSGLSNGTVFTAFAAKDGFGTHVQVELSDSKTSMQILVKGSNVTDSFYREVRYKYSFDEVEVIRDNSGNKTKVLVSFPCGVSFTVNVGIKNLELEMQVVKTLKNKTKGLLGNFNGKSNDEFTLPNGTILSPNLTESQIFYNFASEYQITPNNSVFVYKSGKTASDYQHPSFVPVFLDSVNATLLQAATRLCGEGNTACIYDFFITNDAAFALNTGKTLKQSLAKRLLLANSCPSMTIVQNINYSNKRWIVQDGVVNTLRISGTDADNDSLTYMLYENVNGVSINQSGFLFYTPSILKPVKFGFRLKDSKNCYTPVVDVQTAICPQCRNNGSCNRKKTRNVEYFGGQVQILKCDCPPGYTGEYCESELDACLAKPCYKGRTCTDLTAAQQGNSTVGYVCGPCPKGYEEIEEYCFDIDECEDNTTCHQNCTNTEGSYICSCNDGYVLNRTDSRSCLAKNCSNRCVMQNTWYCDETVSVCMCKDGITTPDCHKSMDHCVSNPCLSDRKCNSNDLGYECVCLNGLPPVNGTCSDCNRILTEKSGSFMSSNYPNNYPDGETCTWTITSNDNNSIILLNFTDYQVEGCPYDFLEIYDGASYDSDLIAQFCIDGITDLISSSGTSLFISFTSDTSVSKRGFFASYIVESLCREKKCSHDCKLVSASPRVEQCLCPEWTRLDSTETICIEINACNTTVTDNTGLIVSPGYPSKYPVNASCHWTLPARPLKVLTISFSDMDIENGVACPYDSLKVYNGSSSSYPLVGSYCGSSLPKFISSSSGLYLDFTSDGLISGRGFKLQYSYGTN